jgi:glycerophosphoryl diester phosphodiesterase
MKRTRLFLFIIQLAAFTSCDRVAYFPDKPNPYDKTYLLGHHGAGFFDEGNTIEACMAGLRIFDGIECDIEKSSENTLWLYHSTFLPSCGSFEEECFVSVSDQTIIDVDSCLGREKNFTQLETVFKYMSNNYPDKFISIDVKTWAPCKITGINLIREMNLLGQKIINLTSEYHLENRVMVESQNGDLLYYIRKNTAFIETYLTAFGDFELAVSRALDAKFSGVSFAYKYKEPLIKEQVDLIHRKGLKIQLWAVGDTTDIKEAILLKPDFIQTDIEYAISNNH